MGEIIWRGERFPVAVRDLFTVKCWLEARAGKPRVRVWMAWDSGMGPAWLLGMVTCRRPFFRLVGPCGAFGVRVWTGHPFDAGKSLQQAWCDFCDEHLRHLGFDVATLTRPPAARQREKAAPIAVDRGRA